MRGGRSGTDPGVRACLGRSDPAVRGFSVNSGETAGQTVFHCHVHLMPGRKGDVEDPTGGVRGVIPGKGNYS